MGSCESVMKTHSEKWLAFKGLTHKGLGSLLLSLASISLTMDTLTFTFCDDLAFFGGRQLSRISSLAPFPLGWEQHTSVAFQMALATAWHWKMHVPLTVFRLSYVCSDSEAKVYTSPLLLFGCYRAINVKAILWNEDFFCPTLLSSTAQVIPQAVLEMFVFAEM